MLQTSMRQQQERRLRHEHAVIFVPRPGSRIEQEIAPGSGIVGVMNGDHWVLYYEGAPITSHPTSERVKSA